MEVNLYLNDECDTNIAFFSDLTSNPFKLGDEINIAVHDLKQKDYIRYRTEYANKMKEDNKILQDTFNLKKIRLVKENVFAKITVANEPKLIYEYHCEIVDETVKADKVFDREFTAEMIDAFVYYHSRVDNELSIKEWLDVVYPVAK
jgi:hypothetical protein